MEGFTTRRVSARAQISHGMCHYHFRDKSDLVRALVEHARDDGLLLWKRWSRARHGGVTGAGCDRLDGGAGHHGSVAGAANAAMVCTPRRSVRNELAAEYARWRRGFAELFADLFTERGLRGLDIQLVGEAFASAADGLVHQQSLDPELDTKGVLTALFEKVAEIDMDAQSSPEKLKRSGSAARASRRSRAAH